MMRDAAKSTARGCALLVMLPALATFAARARVMGRDRALEGSTQWMSLLPGVVGQYLRRAFLAQTLDGCASTAVVSFGTVFSKAGARLDAGAYVGPACHLGLVHIEANVLIGAGVHVTSGRHTHGTSDPHVAIRDQPGTATRVRIGEGAWIGSASVVMADVGRNTIIGAGSVVTAPIPDNVVAAGVPARVLRTRA